MLDPTHSVPSLLRPRRWSRRPMVVENLRERGPVEVTEEVGEPALAASKMVILAKGVAWRQTAQARLVRIDLPRMEIEHVGLPAR